jgi:hypothetical protein
MKNWEDVVENKSIKDIVISVDAGGSNNGDLTSVVISAIGEDDTVKVLKVFCLESGGFDYALFSDLLK